jgi:hypothetical protein
VKKFFGAMSQRVEAEQVERRWRRSIAVALVSAASFLNVLPGAGSTQIDAGRYDPLSWTGRCFPDGERELVSMASGEMVRITSNKGVEGQEAYASMITCEWLIDGAFVLWLAVFFFWPSLCRCYPLIWQGKRGWCSKISTSMQCRIVSTWSNSLE